MHLFIFGYGYTARHIATSSTTRLTVTVQSLEKRDSLRKKGIRAYTFTKGRLDPLAYDALKSATHILGSVPPVMGHDPAARFLTDRKHLLKSARWLGYLSATSVYGNRGGDWVDENSPLRPLTRRGKERVKAEQDWHILSHLSHLPLSIFRLAGIYGPGRNPLEKVQEGKAQIFLKPGQVFSRIHVEDIARTIKWAMQYEEKNAVYNLADQKPASTAEVTYYAAKLLGKKPPQAQSFDPKEMSDGLRGFYLENKRVDSQKIWKAMRESPRYPSYVEGLNAIYKGL